MAQKAVQLPPGMLIDWTDLTDLISKALYPGAHPKEGLPCVSGKRYYTGVGNIYTVTVPLEAEDEVLLANVLPNLPALTGSMSQEDVDAFLLAYRSYPGMPSWEPNVPTENDRKELRFLQFQARSKHEVQLGAALKAGEIRALDAQRIAQSVLYRGVLIPRSDAIRYLEAVGIPVESTAPAPQIVPMGSGLAEAVMVGGATAGEPDVSPGATSATANGEFSSLFKGESQNNGKFWTEEKKTLLRKFVRHCGSQKLAAARLGISRARVGELLSIAPSRAAKNSPNDPFNLRN